MKKATRLLIVLLFFIALSNALPSYADKVSYKFFIDGKETVLALDPERINGAIYVPLRFFSESLGADVTWEKSQVTIKKGETTLTSAVDSSVWVRDGEKFSSKEKTYLSKTRVFVPFRMVGELLNYEVGYDATYGKTEKDTIEYSLNLKTVKDKKVEPTAKNLDKTLSLSPDGKWGILTDRLGNGRKAYNFYIKDMNSQEIKKVYSSSVFATEDAEWTKDNTVLLGGLDEARDPYARVLLLYDPSKDELQTLFSASRYLYSPKRHTLIFTQQTEDERMRLESGKTYLYEFKTKKKTPITLETYQKLEEAYYQERA